MGFDPAPLQGAIRRKNCAAALVGGIVKKNIPLFPAGVLVTRLHETGGVRLVAQYNWYPVAGAGQERTTALAEEAWAPRATVLVGVPKAVAAKLKLSMANP